MMIFLENWPKKCSIQPWICQSWDVQQTSIVYIIWRIFPIFFLSFLLNFEHFRFRNQCEIEHHTTKPKRGHRCLRVSSSCLKKYSPHIFLWNYNGDYYIPSKVLYNQIRFVLSKINTQLIVSESEHRHQLLTIEIHKCVELWLMANTHIDIIFRPFSCTH